MKIVKARIDNFMSYGGENQIALKDRGLLLIEGENLAAGSASSNGSGKTSLVDSLPWCFWSETTKGVLADEVVNKQAGKDCLVSVILEDSVGKLFEVVRTRKHSKYNNSLMFRRVDSDGKVLEDLAGIDTAATQERICNFLMTYQVFMNSTYFAQESLKPFCELTDKQIKDVFMKALSLERFMGSLEAVRTDVNAEVREVEKTAVEIESVTRDVWSSENRLADLEGKHGDFLTAQAEAIVGLKSFIEREQRRVFIIRQKQKEFSETLEKQEELRGLIALADELKKVSVEMTEVKAGMESDRGLHQNFLEKKKSTLSSIQGDIEDRQLVLAKLDEREAELEDYSEKIDLLKAKTASVGDVAKLLADLRNQINEYAMVRSQLAYQVDQYRDTLESTARASEEVSSRVGTACPECGRTIVESCFESILAANKAKIDECQENIEKLSGLLELSGAALDGLSTQKDELEKREATYKEAQETILRLSGSVSAIRREITDKQKVLVAIESLKDRKAEVEAEESPFLEMIKQKEFRLEVLQTSFSALMDKLSKTKAESRFFASEEASALVELQAETEKAVSELQAEIAEKSGIEARLENYKKQLVEKEAEVSPYLGLIEKEKLSHVELVEKKTGLEMVKAEKEERLEYLRFLEVAFGYSGLPSFMLDAVVPYLNERAAHYSSIICDGEIRVEFCTTKKTKKGVKDKFEIQVSHTSGGDRYRSVSGGEKRRADLIIAQAMQDLVRSFGQNQLEISIFDEPFASGLDGEGVEGVLNLLEEAATGGRTVLLVSHLPELKSISKSVVTVRKDKSGVSKIIE
jgi:DNA repair exonuclease SbcCD ATPase subunit